MSKANLPIPPRLGSCEHRTVEYTELKYLKNKYLHTQEQTHMSCSRKRFLWTQNLHSKLMPLFFSRQNVDYLQERRLKGRELLLSTQETSMVQQVRYATEANRFNQCPLGSTYLLFWNTLLFISRYEQRPVCAHNRSYISSNQAQIDRCGLNPLFMHPPEQLYTCILVFLFTFTFNVLQAWHQVSASAFVISGGGLCASCVFLTKYPWRLVSKYLPHILGS